MMNIWLERFLRELIDSKLGGLLGQIWDGLTILGMGFAGAGLGWLWATATTATQLPDLLLVGLWGAGGLAAGWLYVLWRRPS